jgi:hypothetical protein
LSFGAPQHPSSSRFGRSRAFSARDELLDAFANVDVRDSCLLGNLAAYGGLEALALKRGPSWRLPKFPPGYGLSPLDEKEPVEAIE